MKNNEVFNSLVTEDQRTAIQIYKNLVRQREEWAEEEEFPFLPRFARTVSYHLGVGHLAFELALDIANMKREGKI